MPQSPHTCPLCSANKEQIRHYYSDKKREYFQCQRCQLVFVAAQYLPDAKTELAEYQLHENHLEDEGYLRFLQRLATPLCEYIGEQKLSGLDYGCGPTPALAHLLSQAGHTMAVYDPFFANDEKVLNAQYDFISCSEAIEHFHTPAMEWQKWQSLLKPNGILAIMTKRVISVEKFANWHYKNDQTHVSFFSEATFEYLAQQGGYEVSFPTQDVAILTRLG